MKLSIKSAFIFAFLMGCSYHNSDLIPQLVSIQVQDRNGLTETINVEERLEHYARIDFLSPQPYRKVTRVYRNEGKQEAFITTYHPNGQPKQYLEALEMRANGTFKEWHQNGKLKIQARLIGGTADLAVTPPNDWLFDGIAHAWNDEGALIAEIQYEKGLLEGPSKTYNELGILKSNTFYQKGQKQGESLAFHSNRTISSQEIFNQDLLVKATYFNDQNALLAQVLDGNGFQIHFDGDRVKEKIEIQKGVPEGKIETYDKHGSLESIYTIHNGKKEGEEVVYYPSFNQVKLSISWSEDQICGCVKTWYEDGKLESQREYAENEKSGPSMGWYRDGSLMFIEDYEKGKLVSGRYYKKGKKEAVSNVVNGSGIATLFDDWGRFPKKVRYVKGIPSEPDDFS